MPRTQRSASLRCAAEPGPIVGTRKERMGPGSAEQRCTQHRVRDTREFASCCRYAPRGVSSTLRLPGFDHWCLWNTGSPACAGDDGWDMRPRSRGADRPRFAGTLPLLRKGGRRESRMRAAPAVSHANAQGNAHASIQVQRRQSGFPCAMVLRFPSRSPW